MEALLARVGVVLAPFNPTLLPVPNGAPIRLRVERQLGYKMAKYVMRIELVESYAQIARGKGGY